MNEVAATNESTPVATPVAGGKPKRWYIIHAHSGFEKKVAQAILETAAQKGLTDAFEQVVVPTENIVEVRRGKKTTAERKFFPGYVLAKMDMSDATWQIVKTTPKVTGFLGGKGIRPQPITEKEALAIFNAVEEGAASPRHKVHFESGENVKIIDGPFESFVGVVEDVDDDRQKLKVSVSIFGRATPVELTFDQVHKVTA
jgi:transcriptional antiterminator NusG